MTATCRPPRTSGATVTVVVWSGVSLLLSLLIIGVGLLMPTVSG